MITHVQSRQKANDQNTLEASVSTTQTVNLNQAESNGFE